MIIDRGFSPEGREGRGVEVKIPPELLQPEEKKKIADRAKNILAELRQAQVGIILERSGVLTYNLVEGYREAEEASKEQSDQLSFPLLVRLLAGKEISGKFEIETGIHLDGYSLGKKKQSRLPLVTEGDSDLAACFSWLEEQLKTRDSPIRLILQKLKEEAEKLEGVKRVVIVDDAEDQGPALRLVAPFFAGKVFPGAEFQSLSLGISNPARKIVDASFPQEVSQKGAKRTLLEHLVKGSVDYDGRLKKITAGNLREIGARVREDDRSTNPLDELIEKYGYSLENLLGLHQAAASALRNFGISLFYENW